MVSIHAAGVLALWALAVVNLRTYCESFGCVGLGVLWFAWAILYGVMLLLGLAPRARQACSSPRQMWVARLTVRAQLLLGGLAIGYWLLK